MPNIGIGTTPTKKLNWNIKKYKLTFRQKITQFLLWLLWKVSDDITQSHNFFGDLYDNVPEDLDSVYVKETYIYQYHTEKRKEILEWLNEEE